MRTTRLAVPGAQLHVDSDGSGEPLVLVHGTGADASTWYETMKAFSPSNEVMAYDRRGYGRSTHAPVKNHRIHARDLVAVLESIGRPAHVVGWSSGGVVALEAGLARPELFRTLTVIEAPLHGMRNASPGVLKALFAAKTAQLRGKPEEGAAAFYRWASGTRDGGNGFDGTSAEARRGLLGYSRIVLAELNPHPSGSLGEHIAYADIAKSSIPITWILGGASIPWYEGLAVRAKKAAPAIRIVKIPDGSHLLHLEQPRAFEAALRQSMAVAATL